MPMSWRGALKLTKTLANGRQQIVGLQFAPDFVGRLHQDESPVRVEACSDVEICSVTRNALRRCSKKIRPSKRDCCIKPFARSISVASGCWRLDERRHTKRW